MKGTSRGLWRELGMRAPRLNRPISQNIGFLFRQQARTVNQSRIRGSCMKWRRHKSLSFASPPATSNRVVSGGETFSQSHNGPVLIEIIVRIETVAQNTFVIDCGFYNRLLNLRNQTHNIIIRNIFFIIIKISFFTNYFTFTSSSSTCRIIRLSRKY